MDEIEQRRKGLGLRLKSAREAKGLTQLAVADRFGLKKATVSAWETGRGVPDAITVGQLAKLYGISVDALLWDDSLSMEAMQFAAEYDGLSEKQRRTFRVLWSAFVLEATTDERVAQSYGRPDYILKEGGRTVAILDAKVLSEKRAVYTLSGTLLDTLVAEKLDVEADLVRQLQSHLAARDNRATGEADA